MDMFSNFSSFLEILAPSPAPKEPIHNPIIEVGMELPLRSIDGQIFNCFILVPMKQSEALVRCKYILAITEMQIVELYPHSSKLGVAVAADVHELQALVKLKFKKGDQGILLLEYKNGKVSKLLMDDPAVCVGHIKAKMKNVGINGSIKNKNEKIYENAQGFFLQAKEIETQFSLSPSVANVQEMMDLLRKSAEKFGEVNDNSYMEVMDFIKKFLQRSDVNSVLDATVGNTPLKVQRAEHLDEPVMWKEDVVTTPTATPQTQDTMNESINVSVLTDEKNYTPSVLTPSSSHLYLPDVDTELSSLRNALTYQFNEDEHDMYQVDNDAHGDYIHSPSSAKKTVQRCELSDLLDDMTLEFDTLLSSFENADKEEARSESYKERRTENVTERATANDADLTEFLEVDFDETLQEMVNAK